METGITELMRQELELREMDVRCYSPLALAYIGDAVYEVLIRTRVMSRGSMPVSKMHVRSANLVKAGTQARILRLLLEDLTEEERKIFKRGRNAKSGTMAKHATMSDYRTATGFEALIGYLYLTGQGERLLWLLHDGLERIGEFACDTENLL